MHTLILIFASYGFITFLVMLAIVGFFHQDMYDFIKAEVWPRLRAWWLSKGAAIVFHQLGLWLFFVFLYSLVWVLDANGLIWFH